MKILQVIPNLKMGGAEIMCENLTYALRDKGQDVVVVSLFDIETLITKRMQDSGVRVIYLKKKLGFDLQIFSQLLNVIRQEQPDVVHAHLRSMLYCMPIAVWCGIKHKIYTVHSIAQADGGKIGNLFYRYFFKFFHVLPVALSKLVQKSVYEVHKIPLDKIPIIFNGVNLSKCIEKKSYVCSEEFKVLHVGRFADVKNHYVMVHALAEMKNLNVRFQFLGEGPMEEEIRNLAKELQVDHKIDFLGLQSNVYPFLHDADAFLLPSKYEGIPMSIAEAMGTALPIIASHVGGIPDMLSNEESALLIRPAKEAIVVAVKRLMNDENLRNRLGQNAKSKSVDFSAEVMAEKYVELYER